MAGKRKLKGPTERIWEEVNKFRKVHRENLGRTSVKTCDWWGELPCQVMGRASVPAELLRRHVIGGA
jgi:hypothetical protein